LIAYHVLMGQELSGMLSPNPHYYVIQGRAAEIARVFGSPAGGAEHLFLGMLHDGGWPVSVISGLADLGQAEAAVLTILASPGYSPPAPPRFPVPGGYVEQWGADVAVQMGDSYLGVEHALLAMLRARDTVPARALAALGDLDAMEAAVTEAKNKAPGDPPEGAVLLPEGRDIDGLLSKAIVAALPEGATFGFNQGPGGRTWMLVIGSGSSLGPEVTREVLSTALARLGSPPDAG
jgi:hypothetical protein